ncbi:hypothetical protein FNV43_RR27062 [Rhamnella rubrinervis]|uniref:Uncharacterized protein n=1 Tax=Rhamnella rubrinervis TaxID=2594499 RepID=A0A8K0DW58_9ROSA|nr:hypothetical protein FNV43_RR27062 [Rhamnella rubrinervis]
MLIAATTATATSRFLLLPVRCSDSNPGRGFGSKTNDNNNIVNNKSRNRTNTSREQKGMVLQQRKSTTRRSEAPGLNSRFGGRSNEKSVDIEFEERLKAVKRSALEQKKADEEKEFVAIDYDAPVEQEKKTIGLGTKIGVGVAVVVFGLVFALGDFLPSGSVSDDTAVVDNKLSEEEKLTLETRLREYQTTLKNSPKDPTALEGAAVTLAELGEYNQAASMLEDLIKEKPSDPDVFRLLGEVKYKLKDYEGSANAYKSSAMVSKYLSFDVLRGRTNALLAAKKPDEAVQFLLASQQQLKAENSDVRSESSTKETDLQKVDPVQVDLLLGKAYSDWGHVSDAVSVYDQLISTHPDDFRGYLAKGIILKENGKVGDAERMFIQARFFAPEKAKALVDRYSRQ